MKRTRRVNPLHARGATATAGFVLQRPTVAFTDQQSVIAPGALTADAQA